MWDYVSLNQWNYSPHSPLLYTSLYSFKFKVTLGEIVTRIGGRGEAWHLLSEGQVKDRMQDHSSHITTSPNC